MVRKSVLARECIEAVTGAAWFPYRTGDTKSSVRLEYTPNGFRIIFDGDMLQRRNSMRKTINSAKKRHKYSVPTKLGVDYIHFLEEGTKNSQRHVGFISNKSVNAVLNTLADNYLAISSSVNVKKMR